ncbi:hypothetical protein EON65_05835 [archaeon]|nr:MAG: hypothetical protein EON65_05835 [archaeon]
MSSIAWQVFFGVIIIIFSIGFVVRFTSLVIIMYRHQREERIGVPEVEGIRMHAVTDNPILVSDASTSQHVEDLELGSVSFDGTEVCSSSAEETPTAQTTRRIIRVNEVIPIDGDVDFVPVLVVR